MSGEPDNLVLQYLRRMDAKIDRIVDDVQNLKVRMTAVEEGMAVLSASRVLPRACALRVRGAVVRGLREM